VGSLVKVADTFTLKSCRPGRRGVATPFRLRSKKKKRGKALLTKKKSSPTTQLRRKGWRSSSRRGAPRSIPRVGKEKRGKVHGVAKEGERKGGRTNFERGKRENDQRSTPRTRALKCLARKNEKKLLREGRRPLSPFRGKGEERGTSV